MRENPNWSMVYGGVLRCDRPWCWRRATKLCRAWVQAGDRIVTFGVHHCERHTESRLAMNRAALEETS
jgi:hypothetical protein